MSNEPPQSGIGSVDASGSMGCILDRGSSNRRMRRGGNKPQEPGVLLKATVRVSHPPTPVAAGAREPPEWRARGRATSRRSASAGRDCADGQRLC